jgi:hypothetical protein
MIKRARDSFGPYVAIDKRSLEVKGYICGEDTDMKLMKPFLRPFSKNIAEGKIGWAILWLIGVPLPVLGIFYVLRGCN